MYTKQLFYYAKKALRRLWRIITLRPGAYGAVGKHNSYRGCRINEAAAVGSYNYFGPGCLVNYADIGNYCSFAPNSIVAPAEHSLDYATTCLRISRKTINFDEAARRTQIGSDVWCGANTVILQGLTIGNGAVIAAGAVVRTDVPPYAIVGGVPAKILRFRFSSEEIAALEASKWYEQELPEAKQTLQSLYRNGILREGADGRSHGRNDP